MVIMYRVFNLQVLDSRAAQLGALWTKMHKFFFPEFLKTQCLCQATKRRIPMVLRQQHKLKFGIEKLHFIIH